MNECPGWINVNMPITPSKTEIDHKLTAKTKRQINNLNAEWKRYCADK